MNCSASDASFGEHCTVSAVPLCSQGQKAHEEQKLVTHGLGLIACEVEIPYRNRGASDVLANSPRHRMQSRIDQWIGFLIRTAAKFI
jgi:hypothetical protein